MAPPSDPSPAAERTIWWQIARVCVGGPATLGFRLRPLGTEHIPAAGGALLVFNHVSVLDTIMIGVPVVDRGRSLHTLGLSQDFERPGLGWWLRRLDQIPLRRGMGDWTALQAVADVVASGRLGVVAPEGTVGDGSELQPMQKGAARIALLAQAPVIPVGVWGTQRRRPQQGWRFAGPLRPTVSVAFGPALSVRGDPKHRPDVQGLTERIREALVAQVDLARRSAPGLY